MANAGFTVNTYLGSVNFTSYFSNPRFVFGNYRDDVGDGVFNVLIIPYIGGTSSVSSQITLTSPPVYTHNTGGFWREQTDLNRFGPLFMNITKWTLHDQTRYGMVLFPKYEVYGRLYDNGTNRLYQAASYGDEVKNFMGYYEVEDIDFNTRDYVADQFFKYNVFLLQNRDIAGRYYLGKTIPYGGSRIYDVFNWLNLQHAFPGLESAYGMYYPHYRRIVIFMKKSGDTSAFGAVYDPQDCGNDFKNYSPELLTTFPIEIPSEGNARHRYMFPFQGGWYMISGESEATDVAQVYPYNGAIHIHTLTENVSGVAHEDAFSIEADSINAKLGVSDPIRCVVTTRDAFYMPLANVDVQISISPVGTPATMEDGGLATSSSGPFDNGSGVPYTSLNITTDSNGEAIIWYRPPQSGYSTKTETIQVTEVV